MRKVRKLELIGSLIEDLETLQYRDRSQLDAIRRKAEMLIRNFFGENSKYLQDIRKIGFYPWGDNTSEDIKRQVWSSGSSEMMNLFNWMREEVLLFDTTAETAEVKSDQVEAGDKVFIVHGRDESMKQSVARVLEKLGLEPIILHEQPDLGRTVIEKFIDYSNVGFAVVLLSSDDMAYQRNANPENAKPRARQNVVLELGYFLGKLGRDRVVALYTQDEDFEMPSDYSGVLFVPFDGSGRWQFDLVRELKASGYEVDANKLLE
jgi:predicted nucleotide-binding protein